MITQDDFLFFTDRALDEMADIVADLGDPLACQRPDLAGTNSPYAILYHCLGVLEYWVGELIAGRTIERDRDAEFHASGPVGPLLERVAAAKRQLRVDLEVVEPQRPIRGTARREWMPVDREFSQSAALAHVLEELCQHHGQMELTRDLLR